MNSIFSGAIGIILYSYFLYHVECRPNPDEMGNKVEGDILIRKRTRPIFGVAQAAVKDEEARWPFGRVPYVISSDFDEDERNAIRNAMDIIEQTACVSFVPVSTEVKDFLVIYDGDFCESYVGKQGGPQNVSLSRDGCLGSGTILHELMHALGFEHEQSRFDREQYVTVLWGNVKNGLEPQFEKYDKDTVSTLDLPYDYSSVMHYSGDAFQKTDKYHTILALRKQITLGQRQLLSPVDELKLKRMYKCELN